MGFGTTGRREKEKDFILGLTAGIWKRDWPDGNKGRVQKEYKQYRLSKKGIGTRLFLNLTIKKNLDISSLHRIYSSRERREQMDLRE